MSSLTKLLEKEKSESCIGFSSTLRRYNAVLANHKGHTLTDFVKTLAENHQDLIIEEGQEDAEPSDLKFDIATLRCPKCNKDAENSTDLLDHYFRHIPKTENAFFKSIGVISKSVNEAIQEGMKTQEKESFVRRKAANANITIGCTLDSPLASFLSLNHMKVFLNDQPVSKNAWQHKLVKIELKKPDQTYTLFFAYTWIERARNKARTAKKEKILKREAKELEESCQRPDLFHEDLFNTPARSLEASKDLAAALNLPTTCTNAELQNALDGMTATIPKPDLLPKTYNAIEDDNGNMMSSEQRKLIDTFTSNFTHVPGAKRRCARNVSYKFAPQ